MIPALKKRNKPAVDVLRETEYDPAKLFVPGGYTIDELRDAGVPETTLEDLQKNLIGEIIGGVLTLFALLAVGLIFWWRKEAATPEDAAPHYDLASGENTLLV